MKLLAIPLVALAATACTQRNALFCDIDTPCTDPLRPFCDLQGEYDEGVSKRCIPSPFDAGPTCGSSAECTDDAVPICDETSSTCRGCHAGIDGDAECTAKNPDKPICATDGRCRVGCGESGECPGSEPICSEDNQCVGCDDAGTGDEDCEARDSTRPKCKGDGMCVECLDNDTCGGATPICEPATGECRKCAEHDECASEACNRGSGACVAEADIVYVDAGSGADGPGCGSQASPCVTIAGAEGGLAKATASRSTMRVRSGTYLESVDVGGGQTVVFIGTGATLSPPLDSPALLVHNGSDVTVEAITLSNATGNNDADGLRCADSSSSVTLYRAIVTGNDAIGVQVNECSVTIARSEISENDSGGILISNADFSLENNFVINNGDVGTTIFGGVRIGNADGYTTQVFEFNTVARNQARNDADSSGVECSTGTSMTASNNIVYGGLGGAPTIDGNCNWTYSDIEGGATGTGNIPDPPEFEDALNGNFHLEPSSPCVDEADPNATTNVDFDGDARPEPEGGRRDMGADEVAPE